VAIEVPSKPTRQPGSSPPAKSAIVTIRKQGSEAPDLTVEKYQRRADFADATFREVKRNIAATKPENNRR
jgi:hypothetical protein